ncbi:glycerate dehydrogenase [Legionella longbeachae]|nr:D-2-hydroxyacid dehydrogenase [Legionella longbeachae]ARB91424.2 glycerate dehydrogenase [Legionella longbeachae]EEZ95078.1 glycerate dehydrogenase [Legionella longbeachae D-4968]QIN34042.1 D-2-hydroxyacid dehydrogenase [Legionella longbeachae]QIN37370.1 D-2-hydroxyacid dehydrogenase [Legionella longbeachae]RZV23533.1 D-2-hydroxyacid dehydrogenase [Legionella longbeachae]
MSDGLCLDSLNKLGEVTLYDRTPDDLVIDRASEAEIIITNKVKLTEQHFNKLPRLRYIGETATGVDNIDIRAAAKHRIIVTNVPDYSTDSVAQHVLALLLTHTNHVEAHNQSIQRGEWQTQPYFSYWSKPVIELAGMTLGLMGYGRVAQKVARLAGALGMKIIAHKPTMFTDELVSWVSFSDLLKQSDVLSLHCPLNEYTKSMINNETLKQMKPTAVLINTGRGGLINESDLANALKAKQITAAYLDVLSEEPPRINNRLIGLTNCIITPHIAWASVAARKRLLNTVCENIIHFLKGQPINVIRPS